MARTMLLAAALAALAAGARYVDYSGVNMPSYGVAADYDGSRYSHASDDYHDPHPQDISMAVDYKEEDAVGSYKSRSKEATDRELDEVDVWQKPEKNEKRLSRSQDADNLANFDKYHATENVPNFRLKKRVLKRPLRHKTRSIDDEENRMHNQGDKLNMQNIKEVEGFGNFQSQEDIFDDKTVNFRGRNRYRNKENLVSAKVRRKPRDKIDKDIFDDPDKANKDIFDGPDKINKDIFDDPPPLDENELSLFKKFMNDNKKDLNYPLSIPGIDSPKLPLMADDIKKMKVNKPQNYGEYDEYYDMKRVNSIKEKLPSLLRRTTKTTTTNGVLLPRLSTELVHDDILWANRRMVPDPETDSPTQSKTSTESTMSSTTSTSTTPTVAITNNVTTTESTLSKEELSLAEKSRLSILKKAQRKESFGNATLTSKPPVLLQVASRLQTLVMVEPPTSPDPLFRARVVSDDSPEQLDQVKRMMRHKLVAGAKSIRELTDNWDEMVCDYVDMSLLENSATFSCNSTVLLCVTMILLVSL